jgi:HK97 gp10 family phage protein
MRLEIKDNRAEFRDELEAAVLRALERVGEQAEGYAIELAPVDTGALRQSITHKVDAQEQAVYIGSNLEYAAYVELGTGKYAHGGRKTPWVYQDDRGKWHYTHGQRAQPYLKPAMADHRNTYKNIIIDELKG